MQKKILTLLLCSALSVCVFSGCGHEGSDVDASLNDPISVSEQDNNTNYNTIKPPEDGWTIEELLSVTYVCGKQLSYPLTVDELGNYFSLKDNVLKIKNRFNVDLLYKGDFYSPCIFNEENNTESELKYFSNINFRLPENIEEFDFMMNGVNFESSLEDVESAFGKPDSITNIGENSCNYHYHFVSDNDEQSFIIKCDENHPTEFSLYF